MGVHEKFVLNEDENEYIEYWIDDGELKISKENEDLDEYFHFHIYPNNKIEFSYRRFVSFSNNVVRRFEINKVARNPLNNKYTFESVRDYLSDESKNDGQKIMYIERLLREYFEYYRPKKSWSLN